MKNLTKIEWTIFIIIVTFLLAGCADLLILVMLEKY
jgi:hypothetical protein